MKIRSLIFSPGSIKTKMGKTDVSQDYETFLDPKEVAEYILYSDISDISDIPLYRYP